MNANILFSPLPIRFHGRTREVILFVCVGLLNTIVDFAVLNLLIILTHHNRGNWLLIYNGLSFLAAVTNSYVLNRRFTFRDSVTPNSWGIARFVMVNAVGLVINSVTVWALSPLFVGVLTTILAINVSKVLATLLSLSWNYFAIKQWIFRIENLKTNNRSGKFVEVVSTTIESET